MGGTGEKKTSNAEATRSRRFRHKFNGNDGNKCISSIFHRLADTSLDVVPWPGPNGPEPNGPDSCQDQAVSHKLHEIINISSIKYKICKSFLFSFWAVSSLMLMVFLLLFLFFSLLFHLHWSFLASFCYCQCQWHFQAWLWDVGCCPATVGQIGRRTSNGVRKIYC